jgi:hypothetical protein
MRDLIESLNFNGLGVNRFRTLLASPHLARLSVLAVSLVKHRHPHNVGPKGEQALLERFGQAVCQFR